MTIPARIQLRRFPGWRKPAEAVVVTRRSKRWGNPYPVEEYGREEAIRLYIRHLAEHPELIAAARKQLFGQPLACWCPPDKPCHADVLLVVANL